MGLAFKIKSFAVDLASRLARRRPGRRRSPYGVTATRDGCAGADIFVFDPAKIDLAAPVKVTDLPEDPPRFTQGAKGIHYTIVNGKVLMDNGAHTGA
jgi:N-acyl-D-aspartate/D-glutamate deacylase